MKLSRLATRPIAALAALILTGSGVAVVVPQLAARAATTCAAGTYQVDFFSGQALAGTPLLSRCDAAINDAWGAGGPGAPVPNDNFSARWTRTDTFTAGSYNFNIRGDDGIRLLIDGVNVLNGWKDQSPTDYSVTKTMTAGAHTLVIEYYEAYGDATAAFSYTAVPATTSSGCTGTDWSASYFNNKTLTGAPVLARCDASIAFTWGAGGPGTPVTNDNFSARWTRTITFAAGSYTFNLRGDDGIRLLLDGTNILDGWKDQSATSYTVTTTLAAGAHTVVIEYYEAGGDATAAFSYTATGTTTPPSGCTGTDWSANYYSNMTLGGTPSLVRCETAINNNWGQTSPGAPVPVDNFSARWTRSATFTAGDYTFTMTGDDGIRFLLDGTLVLNGWKDQSATTYTLTKTLAAGTHTLTVEYYENGYDAVAQFSYAAAVVVNPPPPPTGNTGLASTGRWTVSSLTLPARGIHTTLLRSGRILVMAGSGNDSTNFAAGTFTTKVWDPVTGVTTDVPTPYDMFCSDHVTLSDGRVLVMGGTKIFPGVNGQYFQGSHSSYIFNENTMAFTKVNDTVDGHWYPTATKLGNGDVWMAGGLGETPTDPNAVSVSVATEMFSMSQQSWLPSSQVPQSYQYWGEYPAMFLMANGDLFYSGAHVFGNQRQGTGASIYNIAAGTVADVPGLPDPDLRDQAGSVLLPPAQNQTVMVAGGGHTEAYATPTNSVGIINLNDPSPHYVAGPPLPGPGRQYQNLIDMFDRTVLAADGAAGVRTGNISAAAIYNPATNSWSTDTPPDPIGRNYHSSLQLLPDGRVMALGSNPADNSFEVRVSIYEPPYLFRGTRPTVSGPTVLPYGGNVNLTVSSDAVNASLTTLGSQTHQMDSNARLVDLPITGTGTARVASVPSNHNLLPPGPYMLTVLNANGVPSAAQMVTVQ